MLTAFFLAHRIPAVTVGFVSFVAIMMVNLNMTAFAAVTVDNGEYGKASHKYVLFLILVQWFNQWYISEQIFQECATVTRG